MQAEGRPQGGFQEVPLSAQQNRSIELADPTTAKAQAPTAVHASQETPGYSERDSKQDDQCCPWLFGAGSTRRPAARTRTRFYSQALQKAQKWESAQEERMYHSKWYSCLTCYNPQIERAQQARHPDPHYWALGLCDCFNYRTLQGRGSWFFLWALLWPYWAFGMIWTEYVEEPQVCDNVCWDTCVTLGWRGICCCLILYPLQWSTQCHFLLPCMMATSYGFRRATVNKYGIHEHEDKTLLYGCCCPFCSMSQIYLHITEVLEREDILELQESANKTPETSAPAPLEMDRGSRYGNAPQAEYSQNNIVNSAEGSETRTKAPMKQKMADELKRDTKWAGKQAKKEFGRVFRERNAAGDAIPHDDFQDKLNPFRYQHAPWSGTVA